MQKVQRDGGKPTWNKITNYIFDLDGTLIDSFEDIFHALSESAQTIGEDPPDRDALHMLMQCRLDEIILKLFPMASEKHQAIKSNFIGIYDNSGFPGTILYPKVIETLSQLKSENKKLFLATNKRESATSALLLKCSLTDMFDSVVTSDVAGRTMTSKGEMLNELLDRCRQDPDTSLYVGDTKGDWEAARESGMSFVLAGYGYGGSGFLPEDALKVKIIDSFSELIELTK